MTIREWIISDTGFLLTAGLFVLAGALKIFAIWIKPDSKGK
jgi:hypothetical protein